MNSARSGFISVGRSFDLWRFLTSALNPMSSIGWNCQCLREKERIQFSLWESDLDLRSSWTSGPKLQSSWPSGPCLLSCLRESGPRLQFSLGKSGPRLQFSLGESGPWLLLCVHNSWMFICCCINANANAVLSSLLSETVKCSFVALSDGTKVPFFVSLPMLWPSVLSSEIVKLLSLLLKCKANWHWQVVSSSLTRKRRHCFKTGIDVTIHKWKHVMFCRHSTSTEVSIYCTSPSETEVVVDDWEISTKGKEGALCL